MDRAARISPRRASFLVAVLGPVIVSVLAGCALGQRPRLAAETSTGNADVDELLDRVAGLDAAVYTAAYEVHVPFDDRNVAVATTQAAADERSLTIGDVRFLVADGAAETCTLSTGRCTDGHDAALVSDVQMTNDFFGTSLAARLRRDTALAVGPIEATDETFAGTTARCVTIPLPAAPAPPDERAAARYCIFANGVLADLEAADISTTLTGYRTEADEAQLRRRQ
jgi:hypothetical protein